MFSKIKTIFTDSSLRKKILFVLAGLILFRIFAAIPIPGIDALRLEQFLANNQFFGFLNILSGSGLASFSLVLLGVGPYITASIITQLGTAIIPKLKQMYQEDEIGRRKITQYGRVLALPLAYIQGYGIIKILENQGAIDPLLGFNLFTNLTVIAAASYLLMWIGELITERGIGNGVSIIIGAGIVASLPSIVGQFFFTFTVAQTPLLVGFIAVALFTIAIVVFFNEAERRIPVTYAKQVRGSAVAGGTSTHLPIRLTQAGVMPIIFALSVFLFPQYLAQVFSTSSNFTLQSIATFITNALANQWVYGIGYFVLVFLFTYFYISIVFDPEMIANNLQKNGAFISGIRPGPATAEYIGQIVTKVTLFGALFFGVIAVLPVVLQSLTGLQALALGGTSLLIVVSVAIDVIKKVGAQLSMREY